MTVYVVVILLSRPEVELSSENSVTYISDVQLYDHYHSVIVGVCGGINLSRSHAVNEHG